jgi:putative endonuclease
MFVTNPIAVIGEAKAAEMLEKQGFRIVERNWRMGHLEVDLIAENKTEIVFAEVKARTTTFGDRLPEEYVDENKKRRMVAAGNAYIKYKKSTKSLRFDVIGILVDPETQKVTYANHLIGVFQPQLRTTTAASYNGSWAWRHRNKTIGSKRR